MQVIIKGNPQHAEQIGGRLAEVNHRIETTENTKGETLELTVNELQISFSEADFAVNTAEVEKRKACAIDNFTKILNPDEQIISHAFGATTKATEAIYAGCPVLKATTNFAEYLVVYDDLIVVEGSIKNNTLAYGNYKPKPMMLKNAVAMFLVKEFGKALAKMAAGELYNKFFPEDKDAGLRQELTKIKNELIQLLKDIQYENLEDKLLKTRGWMREIYSEKINSYNNKETLNMEEVRLDLKTRQEELHGVAEVIQQRITAAELTACDFTTRSKVMLYATCATLRIVLLKEQIFWQNAMLAKGNQNYANNADVNDLKKYVEKVSKQLKTYVEELKKGRLDKISEFSYNTYRSYHTNKVGGYYKHSAVIKWNDSFESSNKNDPFKGDKIESYKKVNTDEKDNNVDQIKANIEKERNDHVNAVKGLFFQHVEEPLNDVIGKLDTITFVIK